jgi:hypothetical protein
VSLLTNTQGSPERVWSALAGLATFGEQSRAELESLLNPGFLKPGLDAVKTVNIRQVIGAAASLGAVEGDRTSAATDLNATAFSQGEMADWMHDVLCALEPDHKDAVILETYAWMVARSDQAGSMAWMHEMNADGFANAAVEGLLGLDDDGGVKMNKEKVVAWRRWLVFLGLATPLPSPLLPQPSPATRLRRELVRAGVAGTTLSAQEFMALVAARLPYLDRGRLFLQACERLGRRPSSQRLSPMLSIALRDLEDEGALEMAQLGDAGGIIQLAEDPAHLTKGFLSVRIATDSPR